MLFSKMWNNALSGCKRSASAGHEKSGNAARRKSRQSDFSRGAFHSSLCIEPLERRELLSVASHLPLGATDVDFSSFAMGTMVWNVIFPQDEPGIVKAERWTPAEILTAKTEVEQARTYWQGLAPSLHLTPAANLSIQINYVNTDANGVTNPIDVFWETTANKDELWMPDLMYQIDAKYDSTDNYTNVKNFDNDMRDQFQTNWVTTIFVLHNTTYPADDNPNKNPEKLPSYAYANLGGPYMVVEQNSAGWGFASLDKVISHEMGHIFFALDEYWPTDPAQAPPDPAERSGYVNAANRNAQTQITNPDGSTSIINGPWGKDVLMVNNSAKLSFPTQEMVGYKDDDDRDGIPFILDTFPVLDHDANTSLPDIGQFNLAANFKVDTISNLNPQSIGSSNSQVPMTIDTIASAYYRINGGEEIPIPAVDGVFDGYDEDFNLTIDHLYIGTYTIDVTAVNSVGNKTTQSYEFVSTLTPPDLAITKTHTDVFTQGQKHVPYTITVSNIGIDGSSTYGEVSVVDVLPAGLVFANTAADNTTNEINGWSLDLTDPTRPKFTRDDPLAKNSSYQPITMFVDVALDATHTTPYSVLNVAIVSGGGELNTVNDTAGDPTMIEPPADLTITKTHTSSVFKRGTASDNTYTITVTNSGGGITTDMVSVVDALPAGLTASTFSGAGWTVDYTTDPSNPRAYRSDVLAIGASYPALTLVVKVSSEASTSVVNTATVSGGGEVNLANDTATDPTTILPLPDLVVTKTHTGTFTQGDHGRTFTIVVSNTNQGNTDGTVTVVDALPDGLHAVSMSGTGWTVDLATMTATRSDSLTGVASYPALTLTVDVDTHATGTLTNLVTVSGGGELITSNDTAADSVTIAALPGFTPESIRAAYGIDQIGADGTGQTVAIVVPFRVSTIIADLKRFSTQFDLGQFNYPGDTPVAGQPTFTVLNQSGGTNMSNVSGPGYGSTWATRQALSVQWLHAIAPKANIVLIETDDESTMLAGVETARSYPGVTVICTSIGPDQYYTSAQLDSAFTTPAFHPNITFVAAAGNDGANNSFYSAFSPNVLAVGGTTLSLSGDNTIADETGWILGGGGESWDEIEPAYQLGVQNSGMRQMPDVAFLGDPETGVSLNNGNAWVSAASTELSATCWAGMIVLANQLRANKGMLPLDGATQTLPLLYSLPDSYFNDVTEGDNGNLAGPGYDLITGRGTPRADLIVKALGPMPDLTVAASHVGNFHNGDVGDTFTITVTNSGNDSTTDWVSVTDILPAGLTITGMSGTGWTIDTATWTAQRSDALAPGASYPVLTVTVNVALNAPSNVINTAVVSGGGEWITANDTGTDSIIIAPAPDLVISKTHAGLFRQGDIGDTYTIVVSNAGTGPTAGAVSVVDLLPAGLTITAMSGTGWSVNTTTKTATRSDILAVGASYPALTITVNVTANAPTALINTATVSGGGEFNTTNDTASDSTTVVVVTPSVTGTTPSLSGGTLFAGASTITVSYNIDMIGAGIAANFDLRSVGPDGLLGTADDVVYALTASYTNKTTTLTFPPLVDNVYRLTALDNLTKAGGVKLDGNGDGTPGGNWTADFVVIPSGNQFNFPTVPSGGSGPMDAASADLNGDGKADLIVVNNSNSTMTTLLGNGAGGFTLHATLTASSGLSSPRAIVEGDFNKDGKRDVAVANYDNNNVEVFIGDGAGGFSSHGVFSSGGVGVTGLTALAAGDFNADGNLDLAAANYTGGTVGILLGNGSGGFSSAATFASGGANPRAVAAGDFNADGKLDLAVTNTDNNTVAILLGNGLGAFAAPTTISTGAGTFPSGIEVADFNKDGKLDLVEGNYHADTVGILLGLGNGTFSPISILPTAGVPTNPSNMTIADFNGDGNPDLAAANSGSNSVSVLYGNGSGGFAAPVIFPAGAGAGTFGIISADFNGDGKPDLIATNSSANTVAVWPNIFDRTPVTLLTPHLYAFDVSLDTFGTGEFNQGTNNAFDGDGRLMIGGTPFTPSTRTFTTADGGQTLVTASQSLNGLTVNRRITVPTTGSQDFARTVDSFTNTTGSAINATVTIVGNLGSDAATAIFATSSGDTLLTTADQWFGTDNGSGNALIHCFRSAYGITPTSVSVVGDNVQWTFNLNVPAGQTKELGFFTIQASSRTLAVSEANALVGLTGFGGLAALGLNSADLAALSNFQFTEHAPTDITLSNAAIAENQAGAVIGALDSVDVDPGESHAYSIVNDPSGMFEIVGNTLKIKDGVSFDFEALSDPHLTLTIRSSDVPGTLYLEKQFTVTVTDAIEPMVVLPGDLFPIGTDNLTLTLGGDGKVHLYETGYSFDIVPPQKLSSISTLSITGRDNLDEVLTVDFSNGNPIPAGGMTFNGGAGTGNKLILQGTSANDGVVLSAAGFSVNGSAPIAYSNVGDFAFDLGTGVNTLTLDHVAFDLTGNNVISTGTNVIVDGGTLNYNGHTANVRNLTVKNGGHVNAGSLTNYQTVAVTSGTLTTASIVCDTLVIGSQPGAAASSAQAAAAPASVSATAQAATAANIAATTATDSAAAVPSSAAASPVPSESNNAASTVPQIASIPAVDATPWKAVEVAAAVVESEMPKLVSALPAELPASPLSDGSLINASIASALNISGLYGKIAERMSASLLSPVSLHSSVISADMLSSPPAREYAAVNSALPKSRLHDAIFGRLSETSSLEDSDSEEQTDSSALEQTLVHRRSAKNHRQLALAVDALFAE